MPLSLPLNILYKMKAFFYVPNLTTILHSQVRELTGLNISAIYHGQAMASRPDISGW